MGEAFLTGKKGGSGDCRIDFVDSQLGKLTRELSVARWDFAATTDKQGNVWFGGGRVYADGTITASDVVDRFTPEGVRTTYHLSVARLGLAAATDGQGNVWFLGGGRDTSEALGHSSTDGSDVADKFSPDGVRTTYTLSNPMNGPAATTDGQGNVWVTGSMISGKIDKFTPAGVKTSYDLSTPHFSAAATTDGLGNVWFAGGSVYKAGEGVVYCSNAEVFTPVGVRTLRPLKKFIYQAAAATDGQGNVWIAGGESAPFTMNTVEKFTPQGVKTEYQLATPMRECAATTDGNGDVWFGCGICGDSSVTGSGEFSVFKPDGTRRVVKLSGNRAWASAATDGNGNVWVAGGIWGWSAGTSDKSIEVFVPDKVKTHFLSRQTCDAAATTDKQGNVWIGGGALHIMEHCIT